MYTNVICFRLVNKEEILTKYKVNKHVHKYLTKPAEEEILKIPNFWCKIFENDPLGEQLFKMATFDCAEFWLKKGYHIELTNYLGLWQVKGGMNKKQSITIYKG